MFIIIHWNIFVMPALKSLSYNSEVYVSSVLVSIVFSFSNWDFPDSLYEWLLDILAISWDSRFYLSFLMKLCWWGKWVAPHYSHMDVEVWVLHSGSVDTLIGEEHLIITGCRWGGQAPHYASTVTTLAGRRKCASLFPTWPLPTPWGVIFSLSFLWHQSNKDIRMPC